MTESDLAQRLEALEVRYAHQDASLEELTRTVLAQEQLIRLQAERLARLERAVSAMPGSAGNAPADEKPPHY
jgi:SlyX protein